jgi:hypothetical protein
MRRSTTLLSLVLALAAALPVPARGESRYAGGQFRYWAFDNANDLRDVLFYVVPGRWHAQLELWDFVRGDDQFRPELGLHLRDARRSVYTLAGRSELRLDVPEESQHRLWAGTEQVLSHHVVGRAELGVIVSERFAPQYVGTVGGDYYWGSWNFFSASVIRDPREGGLWTFPTRVRLADEANDWLQLTAAPAVRRTLGWAVDAKWRALRLGVERNSRYDFTRRDNVIYTVGLERPLGPKP